MQRVSQTVRVSFDPWRPDLPYTDIPAVEVAQNVTPGVIAYEPFRKLQPISNTGTDTRPAGGISAHRVNGNIALFVADTSKIYELALNGDLNDVSRTAGYSAVDNNTWHFAQYGGTILATNFVDEVQKIDTATAGTTATNLGGSPPKARYIGTIKEFVVLGHIEGAQSSVRWSAINDSESWTQGTNQAGGQVFVDGGYVQALCGHEVMYVFQERAIRRMNYVGPPLIFQFDEISTNRGALAPKGVTQVGGKIFFLADDGFFVLENDQITPIGNEKVDKYFFNDLEGAYGTRVVCAADPINKVVLWAYPSKEAASGDPDKVLLYNWGSDRWSIADYTLFSPITFQGLGYTLEDLDTISSNLDAFGVSLDSASLFSTGLLFAAFDTDNKLGAFTGDALEATIETKEITSPFPGARAHCKEVVPIVDASSLTISIGSRERTSDAITFAAPCSVNDSGIAPVRANGRFVRVRMVIPEAATWTRAQAVDVVLTPQGRR